MIKSNRNAMGNAANPYQGNYKKVLCVCSAGLLRSALHVVGYYMTLV